MQKIIIFVSLFLIQTLFASDEEISAQIAKISSASIENKVQTEKVTLYYKDTFICKKYFCTQILHDKRDCCYVIRSKKFSCGYEHYEDSNIVHCTLEDFNNAKRIAQAYLSHQG